MKKGKIEQIILDRDIYGYPITINYRDSDTFKTRLGSACTLATYVLLFIKIFKLLGAYYDGSMQDEKINKITFDRWNAGPFNLKENDFKIVSFIEPPLPRNVGNLRAFQDGSSTNYEIELGMCD